MNITIEEFDRRVARRVAREKDRQRARAEQRREARRRRAVLASAAFFAVGCCIGAVWTVRDHRAAAKAVVDEYRADMAKYGCSSVVVKEWDWEWLRCE